MKISVDYSEVYQASVYVKNKADSYNDLIQNLYKKSGADAKYLAGGGSFSFSKSARRI